MALAAKIADIFREDANFIKVKKGVASGARGFRAGTRRYLTDRVPIVHWISAYIPRWLISDVVAGQSVGLLLLTQAVTYSTLARVPIQQALLASWLPGFIYTIMGTSRDISVGPTSATAILTGQIVLSMAEFKISPAIVAASLSFFVGIWSLIFGIFNLGCVFDLVSVPIAIGFTMGIAVVVTALQLPAILGLTGIPMSFTAVIPSIVKASSSIKPVTVGISVASILILVILQIIGRKWGHKKQILRHICNSRSLVVISIFTLISYVLNKDSSIPLWPILGPIKTIITTATVPSLQLIKKLFALSIYLFVASSLEHIALAKTFSTEHGYSINQSQELFSLGIANLFNSFFGGIPVSGGDLARTSVLATSGVRSPLSGLFSSTTVLVSIYTLSPFLRYLPQSTVAAVVIVSVFAKQPPPSIILKYWKLSFVDFIQFMIAFNITMFKTAEIGISISTFFILGYTLMRTIFSRSSEVKCIDLERSYGAVTPPWWAPKETIPAGTQVVKLVTDCIFLNADRIKCHIIDTVYTYQTGIAASTTDPEERHWNLRLDKHIRDLRRRAGVSNVDTFIPRLRVVVLDLSSTSFIDSSGIASFQSIKKTLLAYGGESVEFRFVGVCSGVKRRFERAGWMLVNPYEEILRAAIEGEGEKEEMKEKRDLMFDHLPHAIGYQGAAGRGHATFEFEAVEFDTQKTFIK